MRRSVYVGGGRSLRYGLGVGDERETDELREVERRREAEEEALASQGGEPEEEIAQHERRAEKARYLLEKLDERAASEREAGEGEGSAGDRSS
jgi:hypothetical protein